MSRQLRVDIKSGIGSQQPEDTVMSNQPTILNCIVRCRYQTMTSEDTEDLVFAVVI
jgi:hypothetical protein